jgi:3-oxoadipate enol-lactonase
MTGDSRGRASKFAGSTGDLGWSDDNPGGHLTTVLIHSLGTDRGIWSRETAWLAESGRRVIAVDLPGHGQSSAQEPPYTIDGLGGDVAALLEETVGPGSFEVMGISLGGLIAQWLAVELGDRVSALVAANTAARLGTAEGWAERIAAVETGGMAAINETVVPRFFAPDYPTRSPEAFAHHNRVFLGTDPAGYMGCCAALRDADLRDKVSAIMTPTLVLAGGADVATPPALTESLHQQIRDSHFVVIPEAGHVSNLDRPAAFERAVGEFLFGL